jgi:uncharacterized protein YdeI (YjbR/CyaY-like superfamily)
VSIAINNHTYRSSIASMGGKFMVSLSAENREAAGVEGGDEVEVDDAEPRKVTVPPDFSKALKENSKAEKFFEALSYSNKLRHVLSIEQAKTVETRQRRIEKVVAMLAEGRSQLRYASSERLKK